MMDSTLKFEAMTIGMLLDRCFKLYFGNFILLIGILAIPYVPFMLINTTLQTIPVSLEEMDPVLLAISIGGTFLLMLLFLVLVVPLATSSTTYAIGKRYLGEEVTIGEAYRVAFKRLGTLIWSQILVSLIIMGGALCFIIPGIYLALCYALLIPVIILEGQNSSDSMSRSWTLSEGYRGEIFAVLAIFWGFNFVISMGLGLVTTLLSQDVITLIVSNIFSFVVQLLILPFSIIAVILLYYNCRIRKEGFDLELLAQSLSGEAPPPPAPMEAEA